MTGSLVRVMAQSPATHFVMHGARDASNVISSILFTVMVSGVTTKPRGLGGEGAEGLSNAERAGWEWLASKDTVTAAEHQAALDLMREARHVAPEMAVRERAVVMTFGLPVQTPVETAGKTSGKTSGKMLEKTAVAALDLLRGNPELTLPEVAARLGKSERVIERAIQRLRESGRLARVGSRKVGHWQVLE